MPSTPHMSDPDANAEAAVDLDALVEQTRGAQPLRRAFHALNGSVVAAALTFLPISRALAVWVLGAALAVAVTLDLVRLRSERANTLFFSAFRHLASPREAKGPASSTWYTLGLLLVVAFFPRHAAVSGILVLAFADPAASYLGRRWGRRPFLGASLEGTAVFAFIAFVVLAFRHPLPVAAGAAVVCALAERLLWPLLDDNLAIPLVGATAVLVLGSFL